MSIFDDAILKLKRGQEQVKNLYTKLSTFNLDGVGLKAEDDLSPATSRITRAYYVTGVPLISKDVGLLIGEIVHNFRSCLDCLAWSLVISHKYDLTEDQAQEIQFPMARSKESFLSQVDRRLPGVPDVQRTIIESFQPYHSTEVGRAMLYLRTLSNTDKHRIIVPVVVFPEAVEVKAEPKGAGLIGIDRDYILGDALENGTKLFTVNLEGQSLKDVEMHMKVRISASPAFSKSLIVPPPPYAAVTMEKVLEIISSTCFDILSRFRFDG